MPALYVDPQNSVIQMFMIVILERFAIRQRYAYIKTHGSESRGQEEAGLRDEPVSYLQLTL